MHGSSSCHPLNSPTPVVRAESLNSLLNPEYMEGDNAYFCEHCQTKVGVHAWLAPMAVRSANHSTESGAADGSPGALH